MNQHEITFQKDSQEDVQNIYARPPSTEAVFTGRHQYNSVPVEQQQRVKEVLSERVFSRPVVVETDPDQRLQERNDRAGIAPPQVEQEQASRQAYGPRNTPQGLGQQRVMAETTSRSPETRNQLYQSGETGGQGASISYYRQLRERMTDHFEETQTLKSTTNKLQDQAHKLRIQFKDRYHNLKRKVALNERRRYLKLSHTILKANVKNRKEERRHAHIVAFCQQKLLHMKKRRIYRAMVIFANWQKQWIKHVRGNFKQVYVKQCFHELYLNSLYRRHVYRRALLQMRECFREIKHVSQDQIQYRDSFARMHRRRSMRTAMTSFQEYTARKVFEHKNASLIKARRVFNNKALAWRSLLKFVTKAKAIKGDIIQEKLLDAEGVIIDENGEFIVIEPSQEVDFIDVSALQVQTLVMNTAPQMARRDVAYGNAVNCQQTISTSVQLKHD